MGVVTALLLAGVASFYASSSPDGLEYVAEKTGFLDTADEHAAQDSPMADHSAKGVDDPRLAGGLAGIVGALVVLALAGGLAMAVGMRGAKSGGRGERQREPEPSSRQQQGRLRRPSDRDRRTQRRTGER